MSDNDFMKLVFPEAFVKKIDIKEITPCTANPERIKFLAQADKSPDDILPNSSPFHTKRAIFRKTRRP
jgi:ArsR family metal-binding transcriptional regulator